LLKEEIPDTKEKKIKGTISIFRRFINIVLPNKKTYFSTKDEV
jgi:hypothetical protein